MTIENGTSAILLVQNYDILTSIAQIATIILVLVLVYQAIQLKQQNVLAYNPLIVARIGLNNNQQHVIQISNVGHGTAVDVDLSILDANDHSLIRQFRAFAFERGAYRNTEFLFQDHPQILLRGSYRNVRRDVINERDRLFDYQVLLQGL